jgi:hypothetical protein
LQALISPRNLLRLLRAWGWTIYSYFPLNPTKQTNIEPYH